MNFKEANKNIQDVDKWKDHTEKCKLVDILFKADEGTGLKVTQVRDRPGYFWLNMKGPQVDEVDKCRNDVYATLVLCKSVRRTANSGVISRPTWTELANSINEKIENISAWQHNMTIAGTTCNYLFPSNSRLWMTRRQQKLTCAINNGDIIKILNRYECGFIRSKLSEHFGIGNTIPVDVSTETKKMPRSDLNSDGLCYNTENSSFGSQKEPRWALTLQSSNDLQVHHVTAEYVFRHVICMSCESTNRNSKAPQSGSPDPFEDAEK